MKSIIHDWDDEISEKILRNIRTAIAPNGRLLLLELVLPERATANWGAVLDMEMLVTARRPGAHARRVRQPVGAMRVPAHAGSSTRDADDVDRGGCGPA